MQIRTIMISLCASLFVAMPSFADGFYADGGISLITEEGDDLIAPLNGPEFDSLGARFGFNLSKHFSIEGEAIIGLDSYSSNIQTRFTDLGGDPAQVRQSDYWVESSLNHTVGAYVRSSAPVTPKLNVFSRLGIARIEIDQTANFRNFVSNSDEEPGTTSLSSTFSDVGAAFGAGATYDLTDNIYVRGDLTRFDMNHGDVDNRMISAGIRF